MLSPSPNHGTLCLHNDDDDDDDILKIIIEKGFYTDRCGTPFKSRCPVV